jgi:hypothetical protein
MEDMKNTVVDSFKNFVTNPTETFLNFANNMLGLAVMIWISSVILGFAVRIAVNSYHILASVF